MARPGKKASGQGALLEEPGLDRNATSSEVEKLQRAIGPRLFLKRLRVSGYGGFAEERIFDFDDRLTVFRGPNAAGKTTVLNAIRCVLGIAREAASRRAHIGWEPGAEIEATLRGDDREVQVLRKGDGSPEVRERIGDDWRQVPRPVEWLRQLVDVQGANPADFLKLSDEDKAAAILESISLPGYSRAAALAAAGLGGFRLSPIPDGLHPLEEMDRIEQMVRTARTEIGRQEDLAKATATKLLAGLPADAPKAPGEALTKATEAANGLAAEVERGETAAHLEMSGTLERADATKEAALREVRDAHAAEKARLSAEFDRKAAELRAQVEKRIAELAAEGETVIDAARTKDEARLDEIGKAHDQAYIDAGLKREEANRALREKRDALIAAREEVAKLQAEAQGFETDRQVRDMAEDAKTQAKTHGARYRELSTALDLFGRYRLELAGAMPIHGLVVAFDEKGKAVVTLDGVPLPQVNQGRLLRLANEFAALHSDPGTEGRPYLRILIADGTEGVDEPTRAADFRGLTSKGVQVVAAIVGAGDFEVLRGEDAAA